MGTYSALLGEDEINRQALGVPRVTPRVTSEAARTLGGSGLTEKSKLSPMVRPAQYLAMQAPEAAEAPVATAPKAVGPLLSLAGPSTSASTVEGSWQSPTAAPTEAKTSINPFIAAMGMMSSQFAQTSGQLQAGQALIKHGTQGMEDDKKNAAARLAGFDSAYHMEAEKTRLENERIKATTTHLGAETEFIGEHGRNMAEQTKKLKAEVEQKFPLELKELDAKIKGHNTNNEILESEAVMRKPKYYEVAPGDWQLVEQGKVLQMKNDYLKLKMADLAYEQAGIDAEALDTMKGKTVKIFGLDMPVRLVDKYLQGYTADQHLKGTMATAKTLSNQLSLEATKVANKEDFEAKKAHVDNGVRMLENIMKSSKVELDSRGKISSKIESPETPMLKNAFATNAGQMIVNGSRWKDSRIANQGDQWLTTAVQQKWINEVDAVAMSQGLWRPRGWQDKGGPGAQVAPAAAPTSKAAPLAPTMENVQGAARALGASDSRVTFQPPALRQPLSAPKNEWMDALGSRRY